MPSSLAMATSSPCRSVPLNTRPIASRPKIVAVIEIRDQQLQSTASGSPFGARNVLQDGFEQRLQIVAFILRIELRDAGFARWCRPPGNRADLPSRPDR